MAKNKMNLYKVSVAVSLALISLCLYNGNSAYAISDLAVDMAEIDRADSAVSVPIPYVSKDVNKGVSETAPKTAAIPQNTTATEFVEIQTAVSGPKYIVPEAGDLSRLMQAEVHKNVHPANGTIFSDDLALAIPSPTLFRSVDERSTLVLEEEPLVIDSDELVEVKATISYKDLPTDSGKTKILTGAQFPVVVCSQINSKTAKKGDPFEARLKYDLKIGDRLIAKKGSMVYGHLNYVLKARCTMRATLSTERWYRNSGCLGVAFDEVINDKGEHLPLVALPAQTARIVQNKGEGRVLGVNHEGQVVGPWSQQLRYKAIRVGLNFALAPAGVFSFGAMPVALGLIGAANPSFAFTKPVGLNVRHRRLKGFAVGFLSGVPGSWIIEDCVIKGQESIIKPGDEFLVEFKEEFTGEPASEASLVAGAKTKVHGQVLNKPSKKKKSSPN